MRSAAIRHRLTSLLACARSACKLARTTNPERFHTMRRDRMLQPRLRLATVAGKRIAASLARRHAIRAARLSRPMDPQQVIGRQLPALPLGAVDDRSPVVLWNTVSLLPLADRPMRLTNIGGHFGQRVPDTKNVSDGSDCSGSRGAHGADHERDSLSRQAVTACPVTALEPIRTICPMGKATSPAAFQREFRRKLRAARELKGLKQHEVAAALGIERDTYKQYETRSLMPHHLIEPACEFLELDPRVLLAAPRETKRKTAA